MIGNWTHVRGTTVIDSQVASNRFFQDDLLRRLHEYKPTRHGPARRISTRSAQPRTTACCLRSTSAAIRASRRARSRVTRTTNLQGTVNLTQVRGAHTLRGGVDAPAGAAAARTRRQPVGSAVVHQRVHAAGQRHVAAHAEQPRTEPGRVHARHSVELSTATIQPTSNLRNHFFAAYGQDSWRLPAT